MREGPLWQGGLIAAVAAFLTGIAMGLKLPEMPFCVGFAAALVALGGELEASGRAAGRAAASAALWALRSSAGLWMLYMYRLTGNPLFPYFNEYWKSPLALAAPYRDLRFVPDAFLAAAALSHPVHARLACRRRSGLPGHPRPARLSPGDRGALIVWLACGASRDPLMAPEAVRILFAFAAVSYLVWLKVFAIYRYIILLEMLAPLLIVAAVGLLPLAAAAATSPSGSLFFAALVTARSDFLERAPVEDPYVQAALPPDPQSRRSHGGDDGRCAHGLHRHHLAAANPGAADRRLDGAAPGRHRPDQADAQAGGGASARAAIFT